MHGIIVGRKPVMEALRAGTRIERVVFLLGVQGHVIEDIRRAAQESKVPVVQATRQQFRELATDATTQGVVAIVPAVRSFVGVEEIIASAETKGEKGLILILDEIEDPQNLGAIVRSAHALGAHGVVVPKDRSASVTPAASKASAGAVEHCPVARVTNLARTLEELKEKGVWSVAAVPDGERELGHVDLTGPTALVVGGEGAGVRDLVRRTCDYTARIPMGGELSSLNASVAAGIALYEAGRQRRETPERKRP